MLLVSWRPISAGRLRQGILPCAPSRCSIKSRAPPSTTEFAPHGTVSDTGPAHVCYDCAPVSGLARSALPIPAVAQFSWRVSWRTILVWLFGFRHHLDHPRRRLLHARQPVMYHIQADHMSVLIRYIDLVRMLTHTPLPPAKLAGEAFPPLPILPPGDLATPGIWRCAKGSCELYWVSSTGLVISPTLLPTPSVFTFGTHQISLQCFHEWPPRNAGRSGSSDVQRPRLA